MQEHTITPSALPIAIAIPAERRAIARMFTELTLAFHATIFPIDQPPTEVDANLALVAVAVMLGHADGLPMNASQIAAYVQMPRSTVLKRLSVLLERGLILRIKDKYYLEPVRAATVPHLDRFTLILSKGFAVLGPYLSEL
ncbi:winged helix-turn-helix domain-containing protein [Bradyrhizobium ottawaense]